MTADLFIKVFTSLLIRASEFSARPCKLLDGETQAENFDVPINIALYLQRRNKFHADHLYEHNCLNTQQLYFYTAFKKTPA